MNPHEQMRLEAMKLASEHGGTPEEIVKRAAVYYAFLLAKDEKK